MLKRERLVRNRPLRHQSHLEIKKVFVIDKTESGWWLATKSGIAATVTPGYIQASFLDTGLNKATPESVECNETFIVAGTLVLLY